MIVHDCEQGSDKWNRLRCDIPTASEFSKLVTSTGKESSSVDDYALVLAAGKYAGKPVDGFSGNRYTQRGNEMEPIARADYELRNQVIVEEVGFVTNNLMQYGCSPDGLVGKDGSVEYKCKIAKEHLKACWYYDRTGKVPPEYYAQPQGVMFVTGRKWCDLVFYHPDLPGRTIRIVPDKLFLKTLRKQLKAVEIKRNLYYERIKSM